MKKILSFNCCNKSSQCCICSEKTNKGFNCKICKEGFVCRKCMPQLCESGLCNKCPVCRQEDWRKKNTNQTVIIPIKEADIIIVEPINISPEEKKTCWEELPSCRYIMESIKLGCCILLLSYIIGALSIADHIRYSYSKWKSEHHVIALVVGICEFCIVSYCCWRSLCYPRTDSY